MNEREMRALPIVGRGLSSAIPGSAPLPALINKENRGKLLLLPPDPIPTGEVLTLRRRKPRRSVLHLGRYR